RRGRRPRAHEQVRRHRAQGSRSERSCASCAGAQRGAAERALTDWVPRAAGRSTIISERGGRSSGVIHVSPANSVLNRIKRVLADPSLATYALRAKFDRHGLMNRYAGLARAAGFKRLYLVLSFDCDTGDDADVAWKVHSRLVDMG